MLVQKSPVKLLLIVVIFLGALLLAQDYLQQQGTGLLPGSGGQFTLQSEMGAVSLSDFKDKVVAIYFGYMSCPDICPTSLWNLSEAVKLLKPEQAARIQGIFISLDPERDSPHALGLFARGFNKAFIGLTDSKAVLDKVARQYSVVYKKVPLADSAMGYVIDHSSVIYLIDQQGILQYFIPHNATPEEIKGDLEKLLS